MYIASLFRRIVFIVSQFSHGMGWRGTAWDESEKGHITTIMQIGSIVEL